MTRYPYLLFDADNTLFDFDEANVSSFRAVCAYAGLASVSYTHLTLPTKA